MIFLFSLTNFFKRAGCSCKFIKKMIDSVYDFFSIFTFACSPDCRLRRLVLIPWMLKLLRRWTRTRSLSRGWPRSIMLSWPQRLLSSRFPVSLVLVSIRQASVLIFHLLSLSWLVYPSWLELGITFLWSWLHVDVHYIPSTIDLLNFIMMGFIVSVNNYLLAEPCKHVILLTYRPRYGLKASFVRCICMWPDHAQLHTTLLIFHRDPCFCRTANVLSVFCRA